MQEFAEARFHSPHLAVVDVVRVVEVCARTGGPARGQRIGPCARQQTLAQRLARRQLRLLFHERDAQSIAALQFAVVELHSPGNRLQEGGLPRAVTADQPESFARAHGQLRAVEQGAVAEGQMGVEECDE